MTKKIADPGLVDAIAKSIDGWHEAHEGVTVGEVVDALERVRATLIEATNETFSKPLN